METSKRVGYVGLLVAVGLVLSILESFLPPLLPLPGARLGLANLATVIALFFLGPREALEVTIFRCLLGSLLRGSFIGLALSLSGGVVAWSVMSLLYLLYRVPFSMMGISIAGAVAHNSAQLGMAMLLIRFTGIYHYLPYLLIAALPTGFLVGIIARRLVLALEQYSFGGLTE